MASPPPQDPENAAYLHHRGFAHRKRDRYEAAIADYTAALALHPHNAAAYNNRGFAARKLPGTALG